MKTFKVKNYKGNLVESLKKFSDSHKGMKIIEACEDGKDLKIKTEEAEKLRKTNSLEVVISRSFSGFEIPKSFTLATGIKNNGNTINDPETPIVKCIGYDYCIKNKPSDNFSTRCDPRLVEWVKNNANKRKGLIVVEVPSKATDIQIIEYDGGVETLLYVVDGHIEKAKTNF